MPRVPDERAWTKTVQAGSRQPDDLADEPRQAARNRARTTTTTSLPKGTVKTLAKWLVVHSNPTAYGKCGTRVKRVSPARERA